MTFGGGGGGGMDKTFKGRFCDQPKLFAVRDVDHELGVVFFFGCQRVLTVPLRSTTEFVR